MGGTAPYQDAFKSEDTDPTLSAPIAKKAATSDFTSAEKMREREREEQRDRMLKHVLEGLLKKLKGQDNRDEVRSLGLKLLFPKGLPTEKQVQNAIRRQAIILNRAHKHIPRYIRATARMADSEHVPNLGSDLWLHVGTWQRSLSTLVMFVRVLIWSTEAAGLFLIAHAGTLRASQQTQKFLEAGFGVALALQRALVVGIFRLSEATWDDLATKTEEVQYQLAQSSVHLTPVEIFLSWKYVSRVIGAVDAHQIEKIVKQAIDELRLFNAQIPEKRHVKSAKAYVSASHDAFSAFVNVGFGSGINHGFISTSLAGGGVLIGVLGALWRVYNKTRAFRDRRKSSPELDEFHQHLLEKGVEGVPEFATEIVGRKKRYFEIFLFGISLSSIVLGTVFMIRGEAARRKEPSYGDDVLIRLIPAVLNYALALASVWKFRDSSVKAVKKGIEADCEFFLVQKKIRDGLEKDVPEREQRRRDIFPYQILRDYVEPPESWIDMCAVQPKMEREYFQLDIPEHLQASSGKGDLYPRVMAEVFLYALIHAPDNQHAAVNYLRLQYDGASCQYDQGNPVPLRPPAARFIRSICEKLKPYEEVMARPRLQTVRIGDATLCYTATWINDSLCQLSQPSSLPSGLDISWTQGFHTLLKGPYNFQVVKMENELNDRRPEKMRRFAFAGGRTLLAGIQLANKKFQGVDLITCSLDYEARSLEVQAAEGGGKIKYETRQSVRDELKRLPRNSLDGFDFDRFSSQQMIPRIERNSWKAHEKGYPLYDMYDLGLKTHLTDQRLVLQRHDEPPVSPLKPTRILSSEDGVLVCVPLDKFRVLNQEMRILGIGEATPRGDVEAKILNRLNIPVRIWEEDEVDTPEAIFQRIKDIARRGKFQLLQQTEEGQLLKLRLSEGQEVEKGYAYLNIVRRQGFHFDAILPAGFQIDSSLRTATAERAETTVAGRDTFYTALRAAAKSADLASPTLRIELGDKEGINIRHALSGDEGTLHVHELRKLVVSRMYEELKIEDSDLEKNLNKLAERAFDFRHVPQVSGYMEGLTQRGDGIPQDTTRIPQLMSDKSSERVRSGEVFDIVNLGQFLLEAPSGLAARLEDLKALLPAINSRMIEIGSQEGETGSDHPVLAFNDLLLEHRRVRAFDLDNKCHQIENTDDLPGLQPLLADINDGIMYIRPLERNLWNKEKNSYFKYISNWINGNELNLAWANLNIHITTSKVVSARERLAFEGVALKIFVHAYSVAVEKTIIIRTLTWYPETSAAWVTGVLRYPGSAENQKVRELLKGWDPLEKGEKAVRLREKFDDLVRLPDSTINERIEVGKNKNVGNVKFEFDSDTAPKLSAGQPGLWEPQEKYLLLNREMFAQAINDCILWADHVEVFVCQLNQVPVRVWRARNHDGKVEWRLVQNYDFGDMPGYIDLLREGDPSHPGGHYLPVVTKRGHCDTGTQISPGEKGQASADGNCFYDALAHAAANVTLTPNATKFLGDGKPDTLHFAIMSFIREELDNPGSGNHILVAEAIDNYLSGERDNIYASPITRLARRPS